jgi:hypothetical protein
MTLALIALIRGTSPSTKRLLEEPNLDENLTDDRLRDKAPFRIPLIRSEGARARLVFYGRRLWNTIQPSIRDTKSESGFSRLYRIYLMDTLTSSSTDLDRVKFYDFA